jgi:hypothetical protein
MSPLKIEEEDKDVLQAISGQKGVFFILGYEFRKKLKETYG